MNAADLSVATMTWARSPAEETALRHSLEKLAATGLPVAVADTGISAPFTDFLRTLPRFTIVIPQQRGLVAQVQAALALAATFESPFILYTEPDKERFFEQQLAAYIDRAPERDDTGVVLAARSEDSLATFPRMQRYTEGVINHLVGEVVGVNGDYSYGPFVMRRDLVPAIAAMDRALGWGWRHAAFISAFRRGLRIEHVVGDYQCPPDQRDEDDLERTHRLRQLGDNIRGLITPPAADPESGAVRNVRRHGRRPTSLRRSHGAPPDRRA
jgi:hypothetical protein